MSFIDLCPKKKKKNNKSEIIVRDMKDTKTKEDQ